MSGGRLDPECREHPKDVRHYQRSVEVAKLGLRDPVCMDLEGAPRGQADAGETPSRWACI